MRRKTLLVWSLAWGLTSVCWAQVQDVSQHFISARSGMVNYLDGSPKVFHGLKDATPLSVKDQLRAGDRVELGDMERMELLLNPGSYLRVGGRAELEVSRTSFEDTRFGLSQGVAIVESGVFNKKTHSFQMTTPSGDVNILDSGLYRFEVNSPQGVFVSIEKGQAKWFRDGKEMATLKAGKRFNLTASTGKNLQSAKLDKDQMDDFDLWSKRRAEFLVAANSRMSSWGRETAYMDYGYYGYPGYLGYRYWGGWGYNPFYNCYTYVPFNGVFASPYGFVYQNFYPFYGYGGYYGGYGGGSRSSGGGSGGSGTSVSHTTTGHTRTAATTAPSAPSSRMDAGRSDTSSRSSSHSQIHR